MKASSHRKHYLIDADGKILGRLATHIATILSGKGKVSYAPYLDEGDFVVITNTDRVAVTGKKLTDKLYHRYSGYPGGITTISLGDQMEKDSRKVIERAVYGMLPKNKLRDKMMTRLLLYRDAEHPHAPVETVTF